MKKNFLTLFFVFTAIVTMNAQDGIAILPFVEGKALSSDDIGFLDLVSASSSESSRGEVSAATLGESTFEAGQVLTEEEAKVINKAISAYSEANAGEDVSKEGKAEVADGSARGCGYYCYYYYWDTWCYCYEYYWYYCCL